MLPINPPSLCFQVTYQLKIPMTALVSYFLLRKNDMQKPMQWISVALLTIGVVFVQVNNMVGRFVSVCYDTLIRIHFGEHLEMERGWPCCLSVRSIMDEHEWLRFNPSVGTINVN